MSPATDRIPFNRPAITGAEEAYLQEALQRGKFAGGGPFSSRCNAWLTDYFGVPRSLVTSSCTHALEMAALLCDLGPGDEVIAPSFSFPSTATAFVRCGARMVFVDIEPGTMNLDPKAVNAAVSSRTRAIVALHYSGIACDMDAIGEIAERHDLFVIEDAAHAILAEYRGRPCGTLGHFGCFSFHETKNVQCGEGGALLINDARFAERAEVIWEKGTDRTKFLRGEVDKYTWRDIGSSYVMGELQAAFLLAQLERAETITADRRRTWEAYRERLAPLAQKDLIEVADIPCDRSHNGHISWIKARDLEQRDGLIAHLAEHSIQGVFHYLPLHSSPAGERFGKFVGEDRWTTREAQRLLRLPLFYEFTEVDRVADAIESFFVSRHPEANTIG